MGKKYCAQSSSCLWGGEQDFPENYFVGGLRAKPYKPSGSLLPELIPVSVA